MGRTNIVLDDKLLKQAMRLANTKTKREVVDIALREYVKHRDQRGIMALRGKGMIDPNYNYKAARSSD